MTDVTQKNTLTAQEVYDHIVRHAAGMKAPSMIQLADLSTVCLYRSPDGNACFVGCLMTDEEASIADDHGKQGHPVGVVVHVLDHRGLLPERLKPHRDMLGYIQSTHDLLPMHEWPRSLRMKGASFDLDTRIVDEVFAGRI